MNIKIINRIALVLLIIWVLALLPNPITIFIVSKFYRENFEIYIQVHTAVINVISYLDKIVTGLWLFFQTKHNKALRWVWILCGLIYGISAVFLYFLIHLRREQKLNNEIQGEEKLQLG